MTEFAAFLRGINVGGHHKIPMAVLRQLTGEVTGDTAARTYIASGNVVFSATGQATEIADELQAEIAARFGFDVRVLVQEAGVLRAVLESCPFQAGAGNQVYAYLCFHAPGPDQAGIAALRTASEAVLVRGQTVWLHAPDGVGQSKLAARLEALIGAPATARNLNTIRKVVDMLATHEASPTDR
jgi:uncharacterized protein (DUF1697 family)